MNYTLLKEGEVGPATHIFRTIKECAGEILGCSPCFPDEPGYVPEPKGHDPFWKKAVYVVAANLLFPQWKQSEDNLPRMQDMPGFDQLCSRLANVAGRETAEAIAVLRDPVTTEEMGMFPLRRDRKLGESMHEIEQLVRLRLEHRTLEQGPQWV